MATVRREGSVASWLNTAILGRRLACGAGFDVAVWGELGTAGQVAGGLPGYRAAGVTWWVESPGSGPGWLVAVRERLRGPARGGAEVQSPRG